MQEVCAAYARCLFDGNATDDDAFRASEVSTLDYVHPSISGPATLARITWERSFWRPAA